MLRRSLPTIARRSSLPVLTRRSLSTRTEFTFSPYTDSNDLGYGRGTQFCLLTVRHPALDAKGEDALTLRELYDAKAQAAAEQVDELFAMYDADGSGALDESQLAEALSGIGLPPTNAQIQGVLRRLDESGDGQLQRDEFAALLRETWGGMVFVDVRDDMHLLYPPGTLEESRRGLSWLGRTVPGGFLLRALRHSWPEHVESVALMRNTEANEVCGHAASSSPSPHPLPRFHAHRHRRPLPTTSQALDPALMEVFDETFVPSVPSELGTANRIAHAAAAQPPTARGGFVVRLGKGMRGGETKPSYEYVPLIGLPENPTAFKLDARASSTEWFVRLGGPLLLGGTGLLLFAYMEGKKRESKAKKEAEKEKEKAKLAGGA